MQRDITPRRKAREVAPTIPSRRTAGGGFGTDFDCDGGLIPETAWALQERDYKGADSNTKEGHLIPVAHTLRGDGFDASEDGSGRGTPLVPVPLPFDTTQITSVANRSNPQYGDPCHPLAAEAHPPAVAIPINTQLGLRGETSNSSKEGVGIGQPGDPAFTLQGQHHHAVAFESRFARNGRGAPSDLVPPLKAQSGESGKGDSAPLLMTGMAVRRLTPRECERLQEFPDDYTLIPYYPTTKRKLEADYIKYLMRGGVKTHEECLRAAADGPRYKSLGNSMHTGTMRWIGWRIDQVDKLMEELNGR